MALYAFDGTWNEDEMGEATDTNVIKFCKCLPMNMNVFYLEGVGTRMGFVGKLLGGLMGAGGRFRIRDAMERLEKYVDEGDDVIDIIGFSRGAALALHFANQVNEEKNGKEIRFVGIWDAVASFGIPGNDLNIRWTLTLPDNVKHCYHAMALDERRGAFPVTRVKAPKGGLATGERLQEVWFRGVHSDVGGSQSIGLSSIALSWMLRRAKECGLPVVDEKLQGHEANCDPEAEISQNMDVIKDPYRTVLAGDFVHESVKPRGRAGGKEHNDPPADVKILHE